jgi:predicted RNA polymerase sigma factor
MVSLNRAIAGAMVHGPDAGLDRLRARDSDPRPAGHFRLGAVRAHLERAGECEQAGESERAVVHYRAARQSR